MYAPPSKNDLRKSYWDIFREDVLSRKLLMFFTLFTGILCFGFTVTHFSIGIDDPARNYYLYSDSIGNMVQQGRLVHVVLNALTHSVQFIPFFTELVGAALYVLSALLLCGLFQYVTREKISTAALTVFTCVYLSSSILTEKYIYGLDVLATMLSYCCNALALLYAYRFLQEKRRGLFLGSMGFLMVALGSYESFLFLYISGVFALFILEMVINEKEKTFRQLLTEGLWYAAVLAAAMALYYGLVYLLQAAAGQLGVYAPVFSAAPAELGFFGRILWVTNSFVQVFARAIADRYLPILVFCLCSGICLVLGIHCSLRRKNVWLGLCFAALWLCNFGIHYAAGAFLYRAAQTFCFFCGFVLLLALENFRQPVLRRVFCACAALLVFVQSADMNRWFYNDYVRYQKEAYAIHALANELLATCDVEKPVVFTHSPYSGYLDTALYPGRQVSGNSLLYWCGYAWGDRTQPFVSEVFRMHGYDFVSSPTEEQFDRATKAAEGLPAWPKDGCVKEFEDFIVVNFG